MADDGADVQLARRPDRREMYEAAVAGLPVVVDFAMSQAPALKSTSPDAGYERDRYAWAIEQARLLRAGLLDRIDAENIAEEILDVGKAEFRVLESALEVLLMHMLKWDFQPERRSRSWELTIVEQRKRAERQLRENPSLKSRRNEAVEEGFEFGRLRAANEMDVDPSELPQACPYDWDAIARREFKRAE